MPGKIMDGRVVAEKIRSKIKVRVRDLEGSHVVPHLATIAVGENPAAQAYLKNIHAACADVGIGSHSIELAANSSQEELHRIIVELNEDKAITGILLQLPLPKGFDDVQAVSSIAPEKDVDGVNPVNVGLLVLKRADLVPCTPKGVLVLLNYYGVKIAGRRAVVINRSKLVGRPLSQMLLNEDATVTVCHSKTLGLPAISREADVLVTGIGHRSDLTVGAEMIKEGAAVVDIGMSVIDGKLRGDVDFDAAIRIAEFVTPVPGGVGPVTNAMLLHNTLLATCLQNGVQLGFDPNELRAAERT
jgi:methylenetetrahydrofolate dehydrogenase (NADP+)/methenyltetrahydrofolate cyclohydrolase